MSGHVFCDVAREDHLLTVTIRRPEALNALHPPATAELTSIFDEFEADEDLWVAILTGAGERAFCVGNDLKHNAAQDERWQQPEHGFAGLTSRFDMVKPVIAAVNGIAAGGGFELALACDIIVAAQHAEFTLPEAKLGLAALSGGVHRLPRSIGVQRAMSIVLTGRRVPAEEALDIGLVTEVVPLAELMPAARRWADLILAASPMSVRASKQALLQGMDAPDLRSAMALEYPAVEQMLRSADFREGPAAFLDKRPPRWLGR